MPIEIGQQKNKTGHKQRVQYKLANRNGADSAEPAFYVNACQDTANEEQRCRWRPDRGLSLYKFIVYFNYTGEYAIINKLKHSMVSG